MDENKALAATDRFVEVSERSYDLSTMFDTDSQFFTTLTLDDSPESQTAVLSMMGEPDERLIEMVNKEIVIDAFLCEIVELEREDGLGYEKAPRIIIRDTKGVTYGCCSVGVLSALRRIMVVKRGNISGTKCLVHQVSTQKGNRPLALKVL